MCNCFKWLSCCGIGCGIISSIGNICEGVKTIKKDVVENIENHFHPKKIYYLHKEGEIYYDIKEDEEVQLVFFKTKPLEKSVSLL